MLTFSCTRHKITRNGDDYMEIWACEKLDAGVEFNRIQSLSASPQKGLQQELDKIKGVWIKWSLTRKASGYSVKQTAVATKVLTEELDPRSFNLPEGAKKTG